MSATSLEHLDSYIAGAMTRADQVWLLNRISSRLLDSDQMPPAYTIDEINSMLDKSEMEFANDEYISAIESDRLMTEHIAIHIAALWDTRREPKTISNVVK